MKDTVFIVMGVSGSGKTTIGRLLAEKLALAFHDADDFHSAANIEKMGAGIPLTDADRKDWLAAMADAIGNWENSGGAVLACSALKEKYRQTLQGGARHPLQWVYLDGSRKLLHDRLEARKGHYMGADMLDSQLDTLEEPAYGIHVKLQQNQTPDEVVQEIMHAYQTAASK
ncbi:gluconokinase [Hymenobacter sp. BT186]|uniref:Gluconokinase n=1 Tax=Hymenobacter telluris TaxID=2816474 RepID=A0A939EVI6_9BACT|nr:gluconokinase [Hymenobacter telluris]MBO0357992.1 gluconokinase [Hymenobacter telluris]MBW3374019.1 gluconokinase [Hymenobacter norwichensis]